MAIRKIKRLKAKSIVAAEPVSKKFKENSEEEFKAIIKEAFGNWTYERQWTDKKTSSSNKIIEDT